MLRAILLQKDQLIQVLDGGEPSSCDESIAGVRLMPGPSSFKTRLRGLGLGVANAPHAYEAVPTAGDEALAVRAKRQDAIVSRVPAQRQNLDSVNWVPELDDSIASSRGQTRSVRSKRQSCYLEW